MNDRIALTLDCIIFGLQRFGGISNYWAQLIGSAIRDPSFSTHLLLPKHLLYCDFTAQWLECPDISRERIAPQLSRYWLAQARVGGSVFHTSYYRVPVRRVHKYVVTAYDFTYERHRSGLARGVHSIQKRRSILQADAVICISESTRRDVLEFCPGVDASRLHVVHLGVNRTAFFPDIAACAAGNASQVLFVGQRGGYKRFDLAIEALRITPRLSLGIVGPALSDLERASLRKALGDRWVEHGPVGTNELRRLYASSYAFIFPSDYEGFGLPVLEAMACGCPVVAADASSLPEVGGSAAHYAARQTPEGYAEQLWKLDSFAARQRSVQAGLKQAESFTWARTLDQTNAIYRV